MDGNSKKPTSKKPDKGWRDPLWERQEGESARAFQGFATYRDLGPSRSLVATAQILSKTKQGTLAPWSVAWGWVERAGAWDDECDRNQRARDEVERLEAIRKMKEGQIKLGQAFQAVAGAALAERYSGDSALAKKNVADLSPTDMTRLADIGSKIELRARGEATERIENSDAMRFVEGLVDVALGYVPIEAQEAFLSDMKAKLGASI